MNSNSRCKVSNQTAIAAGIEADLIGIAIHTIGPCCHKLVPTDTAAKKQDHQLVFGTFAESCMNFLPVRADTAL